MTTDSWTIKPAGPRSATILIEVEHNEHQRPGIAVVTCTWAATGCVLGSGWPVTVERWSSGSWVPFGSLDTASSNLHSVAEALAMDLAGCSQRLVKRIGRPTTEIEKKSARSKR
jgi:hypothetical protein